ncbi:hypothetical protein [Macrococcoides canis]|nr:hypothetical protein [Macrococcus canis]
MAKKKDIYKMIETALCQEKQFQILQTGWRSQDTILRLEKLIHS